jgi:hypothetical protein
MTSASYLIFSYINPLMTFNPFSWFKITWIFKSSSLTHFLILFWNCQNQPVLNDPICSRLSNLTMACFGDASKSTATFVFTKSQSRGTRYPAPINSHRSINKKAIKSQAGKRRRGWCRKRKGNSRTSRMTRGRKSANVITCWIFCQGVRSFFFL